MDIVGVVVDVSFGELKTVYAINVKKIHLLALKPIDNFDSL